jgi:hypothetical protein
MTDNLALVAYNVNRALQEINLHCEQIDEAVEHLQALKKSLLHNITIAKQSMESLYNAERDVKKQSEEPLRFVWRDNIV